MGLRIRVLFFGPAGALAGVRDALVDLPDGATAGDLRANLIANHPRLAPALSTMRLAINHSFASDTQVLGAGDEAAVIPPVSGGAPEHDLLIELTQAPIDAERLRAFVTGDPALGGIVTFEGATRAETHPEHGPLDHLHYEAYEEMALRQLTQLAESARTRWSAGRIAIVHRLGVVPPGEASVHIAVACGHRAEAFAAARWIIDTLKQDVPIWKKDVYADGSTRWVEGESA